MEPDDKTPTKPDTNTYVLTGGGLEKNTELPGIEIKIPDTDR